MIRSFNLDVFNRLDDLHRLWHIVLKVLSKHAGHALRLLNHRVRKIVNLSKARRHKTKARANNKGPALHGLARTHTHTHTMLAEPAAHLIARLRRQPPVATTEFFGIENDEFGPTTLAATPAAPPLSLKPATAPTPQLTKKWLLETIANGGVLAGMPKMAGLSSRATERVMALNGDTPYGTGKWWLDKLEKTKFGLKSSKRAKNHTIYRLGDDPDGGGYSWFPVGGTYGLNKGSLPSLLQSGICVHVHEYEISAREPSMETQLTHTALTHFLKCDAAASSIAPAVLAAFHIADDDRVNALVSVEQNHTFTFAEMLDAYSNLKPIENMKHARDELISAAKDIIKKLKKLSDAKIVNYNLSPHDIGFCPELTPSTDDEWNLSGYAFGRLPTAGLPHLLNFDGKLCKRLTQKEGYHPGSGHASMAVVFLAAARAYNPGAYQPVLEAALESQLFQVSFASATDRLDSFSQTLSAALQHNRVERDAISTLVLRESIDDYSALIRLGLNGLFYATVANGTKPAFKGLIKYLNNTTTVDATIAPTIDETLSENATLATELSRVACVREKRLAKLK